jgi:hypothetical protein
VVGYVSGGYSLEWARGCFVNHGGANSVFEGAW